MRPDRFEGTHTLGTPSLPESNPYHVVSGDARALACRPLSLRFPARAESVAAARHSIVD